MDAKDGSPAPALPEDFIERVRRKELANLVERVKNGGTLTAAQWARMLEFSQGSNTGTPERVSTISELCEACEISRPTFYYARKQFKDFPKRRANGEWIVSEVKMFLLAKGIGRGPNDQPGDNEKYSLDIFYLKIRCKDAVLDYMKKIGSLVDREEAERIFRDRLSSLRMRLMNIPNVASKRCEMKSAAEIFSILDESLRSALETEAHGQPS